MPLLALGEENISTLRLWCWLCQRPARRRRLAGRVAHGQDQSDAIHAATLAGRVLCCVGVVWLVACVVAVVMRGVRWRVERTPHTVTLYTSSLTRLTFLQWAGVFGQVASGMMKHKYTHEMYTLRGTTARLAWW